MFGVRIYTESDSDLFDDLVTLAIGLASFETAIKVFWDKQSDGSRSEPGITLNIFGRVANATIHSAPVMQEVAENRWPTALELRFHAPGTHVSQR